jgi:hypothetical protein
MSSSLITTSPIVAGRRLTMLYSLYRMSFWFRSSLKSAKNSSSSSTYIFFLAPSSLRYFSTDRSSVVGLMMLLGQTLDLSFEPTIWVDLVNPISVSLAESPKSVLAQTWTPITWSCFARWALCGDADGPRRGQQERVSLRQAGRSVPGGRMVHACAGRWRLLTAPGSGLPGGTPPGRRTPKVCLGIDRHPR